jgi:hypothetical protein
MPRTERRRLATASSLAADTSPNGSPPSAPPLVLDPLRVFTAEEFRRAFGLRSSTLRREVRQRRLRVAKRAGKYFILGEWALEWLRGGELACHDC